MFIKTKKWMVLALIFVLLLSIVVGMLVLSPNLKYNKANKLIENGEYAEAKKLLVTLDPIGEAEEKIKECNHMILYNYILENGTPYREVFYIQDSETGMSLQVRKDDTNIRTYYEYSLGGSTTMSTMFMIPLKSNNLNFSYFLEMDNKTAQGDGKFYPNLYDSNLKNISEDVSLDKIAIIEKETDLKIYIDDALASPYIAFDSMEGDTEVLEELCALQFYCDLNGILSNIEALVNSLNCGVSSAELGIILPK